MLFLSHFLRELSHSRTCVVLHSVVIKSMSIQIFGIVKIGKIILYIATALEHEYYVPYQTCSHVQIISD